MGVSLSAGFTGGGSSLPTPTRAIKIIDFAGNGDNEAIAASGTTVIKIYKMVLVATAAVNVVLKDGATAKTGAMTLTGAGSSIVLDLDENPLVLTAGQAFNVNLSGAIAVDGFILYSQA